MSRRAVVLLACCALLACREKAPPPAAAKPIETKEHVRFPATPDNDADNSLNLMYGATVVSRGGELHLENSAIHTIDGFRESAWTSAPGVPEETIVYSMLAPTRLHRVGISTSASVDVPESVAFDTSMDGRTWTELTTLKTALTEQRQFVSVKPTVAHYLRMRTIDPQKRYHLRIRGVHVMGEEVAAPRTPPFTGCWSINGEIAHLVQNGARISGTIGSDPPTFIDGGTDNRVGMVMWMRGPTWGYAAITRSPDGRHLSGLSFFEEADINLGEGWFGERCASHLIAGGVAGGSRLLLERAKRYSLYGLAFDGNDRIIEELSAPTLDVVTALLATSPSQKFRIIARELRFDTPELNRQHTTARVQAIRDALAKRGVDISRIEFVSAGNDIGEIAPRSALQRALLSRVDLVSGT